MDALDGPLPVATGAITAADYAVQALAEAMAERIDPVRRLPPTDVVLRRASEIVRATLDVAGRSFVVLLTDDEVDAKRLASACGKLDGDSIGEALLAIKRLTGE